MERCAKIIDDAYEKFRIRFRELAGGANVPREVSDTILKLARRVIENTCIGGYNSGYESYFEPAGGDEL